MFKSDLDRWYDSLPVHTREWIRNQPIWHDSDMIKAAALGIVVGLFIGILV